MAEVVVTGGGLNTAVNPTENAIDYLQDEVTSDKD